MSILLTKIDLSRRPWIARIFIVALYCVAVGFSVPTFAAPNLSNSAELSKAIGVPKDSRFYGNFFEPTDNKVKTTLPPKNKSFSANAAEEAKISQVIRHYRGTAGQPFTPPPTSEQVLAASRLKKEDVEKILEIAKDSWKLPLQVLPTPQKVMPTCMINKTEKVAIPKTPKTKPNQLIFDYLFVQKDDMPIDPGKAFGKRTSVFEYETAEHAAAYLAMAVKATCLPYRIRVTGKYIYRHFGVSALYNFDQQYDGKGKLDKSIAEKFKKVKK